MLQQLHQAFGCLTLRCTAALDVRLDSLAGVRRHDLLHNVEGTLYVPKKFGESHTAQVALFAEQFKEMLETRCGRGLLRCLYILEKQVHIAWLVQSCSCVS